VEDLANFNPTSGPSPKRGGEKEDMGSFLPLVGQKTPQPSFEEMGDCKKLWTGSLLDE
jgi:hypothetical protein